MPGRSHHSGRVVIMDDIAWSEPAPRGRRAVSELDPPAWIQSDGDDWPAFERDADARGVGRGFEERPVHDRPSHSRRRDGRRDEEGRSGSARAEERDPARRRSARFRAEDYLDERDYAAELSERWDTVPAAEPVVIEYTDITDEEEIWGPRPRLLSDEPGGRRTVIITGRGGDRAVVPHRPSREALAGNSRQGFQADRTAMWAVLLCVIVLLAAVASH